jgi:hypothetical protein
MDPNPNVTSKPYVYSHHTYRIIWTIGLVWGINTCNHTVSSSWRHQTLRFLMVIIFFFLQAQQPQWAKASSFTMFLDHTQRRTTVGRTPLDEWSVRRRDLYLTTHTSSTTDVHGPGGIRTYNLSRRAVADLRIRPQGQWDRHSLIAVV